MKRGTHDKLIRAVLTDQDLTRSWIYRQAQGTTKTDWNKYLDNFAEKLTGVV